MWITWLPCCNCYIHYRHKIHKDFYWVFLFVFSKVHGAAGLESAYSDFVTKVINAELLYSSKEERQWNKTVCTLFSKGKKKNCKAYFRWGWCFCVIIVQRENGIRGDAQGSNINFRLYFPFCQHTNQILVVGTKTTVSVVHKLLIFRIM